MEQKKILWVILSVSLFVLIIFGIALFLYSPSRNSAIAQAGGEAIPYESATAANVDPDLWARNPDRVAGLDKDAPSAAGNIINLNNVNIISTDGQSGQTSGIDVTELTAQAGEAEVSGLPKELAEQIGLDTASEQPEEPAQPSAVKKEETRAVAQPRVNSTVQAQSKPAVEKKKSAQASVSVTVKPKAKTPAKPAAPQVQTLYWVQTASLANRINAERARDTLAAQHMKVEIFTKETSAGLTHRVRVGPFTNDTEAKYWLNSIKKIAGFENSYVTEEKVKSNN